MAAIMNNIKPELDLSATKNENAIASVNKAVSDITTIVVMSDTLLQEPDGTKTLLTKIHDDEKFKKTLTSARDAEYKTLVDFSTKLTNVQNELLKIQLGQPAIADPLKTLLANEVTAVTAMLAEAAAYLPNADKTVTYRKQRQIFVVWDDRIATLSKDDFVVRRNVPCHTIGNQTKKIDVVLNRTDLYPTLSLSGSVPTAVATTSPLISVSCPSAFSLSGGLDTSFVKTYNYGLIPTATAGTFTYGITKTTSVSPMPIAMVHARLWELQNHKVALQLGVGVAAHTQDDSAGGTGVEYLLGLGISLFRTIYITPGLQAGRTATLSTGYKLGDTAASGVTAAPLVNGYSPGFGLALTFSKP